MKKTNKQGIELKKRVFVSWKEVDLIKEKQLNELKSKDGTRTKR